jgi:excisionase family DNA binding protein
MANVLLANQALAAVLAKPTCSIEEAAPHLGLSRSSAYVAAARGDFPTLKFGRLRRVPTAALRKMLMLDECCASKADGAKGEGKPMAA